MSAVVKFGACGRPLGITLAEEVKALIAKYLPSVDLVSAATLNE
jgi:hypothetical protein